MAFPGQVLEGPVAGRRTVYRRTAGSSGGTAYDAEELYPPGTGREANARHYHRSFDERFEVLEGVATYAVNGVERRAPAGQTIVIPRGTRHLNPWNATDAELRLRHSVELERPDPALLAAIEDTFETLIDLAHAGKLWPNGVPRNVLQLAVMLHAAHPHSYVAGVPEWTQRALFGLLGRIGRAAGHRIGRA